MTYTLVTGNKHKYKEVKQLFNTLNLDLKRIDHDKPELNFKDVRDIARTSAEMLANKLDKTVIVDDTGIYFKAYKGFPGPQAKFAYETIGYKGMMRLLEGEDRKAEFVCAAAICKPGQKAKVFAGEWKGEITTKVHCNNEDVLPYERIFIPEGYDKVSAKLKKVKAKKGHRVQAFTKLAEYLKEVDK